MVAFGRAGLTVSSNVVGFGRLGPAGPKSMHMKLRGDLWWVTTYHGLSYTIINLTIFKGFSIGAHIQEITCVWKVIKQMKHPVCLLMGIHSSCDDLPGNIS